MSPIEQPVILGAGGFVGRELRHHIGGLGTATSAREDLLAADATNLDQLRSVLTPLGPRVLINCVGLADVDRAEREPAVAESLNHTVVSNLVTLQREIGFLLVHISTDYVFDGRRGSYAESDQTAPINEYGRSKLRGEEAAAASDSALILRISAPFGQGFGARRPQFFRYVTDTLRAGKEVRALTDQRVTATYLPDLAKAVETLVHHEVRGIVHVGSREPLSRYEFALKVAEVVGADHRLVLSGQRSEMHQWVAARPGDTTLDVRLSESLGVRYTSVDAALGSLLRT